MNFNWVDITGDFHRATEELVLGELVHDELFGLFEAMSAIEMMDPKMDAGMICNKASKKIQNFDQALKSGTLRIKDLKYDEMIGIIDDTYGCLVTWLEGHSLAQTVFTNLYLHNPFAIEDKCIKAFSILTLKLIDIIKDFIAKAAVYEEEDFQPIVYGYQLACDVLDNKACAMLRDVEEELMKKIKNFQRVQKTDSALENADESTGPVKEVELLIGLHSRLKCSRLFFQSLLILKKEISGKVQPFKSLSPSNIADAERYLQQTAEPFEVWRRTLSLGIYPDEAKRSGHKADYPTIMGFEPLVNQRLLPPTFPRYTQMKTRVEAILYLESLIDRLKTATKVTECSNFQIALDFFNDFTKSNQVLCVLSRSILQVLYLPQLNYAAGSQQFVDCLKNTVRSFTKPPSLNPKNVVMSSNSQAKDYVETFLNHCVRPMATLAQICGHNRARQREKLAQILEDLVALHDEAEKLDAYLSNLTQNLELPFNRLGYFSTWMLYHILRVMIQYLLSGFELELYAIHEYAYIFWYLYEFLFGWMVSTLNRAATLIIEHDSILEQMQQTKSRNAKKVKPKRRKQRPHEREIIINEALQQMCGGFYKCMYAFNLEEKIKKPWAKLNSEQLRYEHRFAPFRNIPTPPLVSYSQYKDMTDPRFQQQTSQEHYVAASKCFQQAKSLLEKVSEPNYEISSYLKVVKTNIVVINLLASGHKTPLEQIPTFDFSTHMNFPIIRIYKNN